MSSDSYVYKVHSYVHFPCNVKRLQKYFIARLQQCKTVRNVAILL